MPVSNVKILVVDDDPALLRLLSKWLETAGYEVERAGDGRQATAAVGASCPQIMVTDWEMPIMDGLELCRWLRKQDLPHYVYTVFVTHRTSSEDMVLALEAGADDFLKKPVDKGELLARVRSGVRVLELESRLSVLAKTDALTGLVTRRTFFELMEREWSRSLRHHIPLSCVMVDIDFFKRINDLYGHRAGDQALRRIAQILQESCRGSDIVGRYGGEEFCVLLPETTEDNAARWAERVRTAISAKSDLIDGLEIGVTASFGVAQRLADTDTADELVDLADQALLVAKRSGRDRVASFQTVSASARVETRVGGPGAVFQGLTAKNVMTAIVAGLSQEETVGRAARYFLRFRFHSAPVVDDDGKLVGILSERDLMSIMLWPRWWTTKIKDVMKPNVVCYEETAPVLMIYEFLCRVSLHGVVIVKDGCPTGMISRGSLLRWFTNLLAVNPSSLLDGPPLDLNVTPDAQASQSDPRRNVAMIAQTLTAEAKELEHRIGREQKDLVPVVVGGVSRLEELINDLLTLLRDANTTLHESKQGPPSAPWGEADGSSMHALSTVAGAASLPEAAMNPDSWFPAG